ncbi:VWA domain-containing protein [Schaalia naturae]|uniref:VWA domain-containing protein n=1 Tax=Schaalia naturae TaxID=635203 RepID=A0ABW2SI57_9ACTO
MILRPVIEPVWWIALFAVCGAALVVLGARRSGPRARWATLRRSLMVAVTAVMLAGPSVPGEAVPVTSDTEVWLVLDRTGSMAAEDWGTEDSPRLDGVREDAETILASMAGARFSVLTWDSDLRTVVPLTTDESAVQSYLDTFHQEASEFSQGSSPDRPVGALLERLQAAEQSNPQNVRNVFVLTDGETSNTEQSFDPSTWDILAGHIDGGMVIGYGTEEGGRMRVYRVGDGDAAGQSGGTGGAPEYIRDYSQPGAPEAISRIDESALRGIAGALGVGYVHSPDTAAIASKSSAMMDGAQVVAESRKELSTYRYAVWPFAIALAALVAWEAWSMAGRVRALRRSHAI